MTPVSASEIALRDLMKQAALPSFRALGQAARVSDWQIRQLRQGKIHALRLATLLQVSQALRVDLATLLQLWGVQTGESAVSARGVVESTTPPSPGDVLPQPTLEALHHEYERLQAQLQQQEEQLTAKFQQASLQVLEPWMLAWPAAEYRVRQTPELPAERLLPLVKPVEALLKGWGVGAIAPVGSEVPYDPTQHQLMEGSVEPGDLVRIRYPGYWYGDNLLHRAKVSPVAQETR